MSTNHHLNTAKKAKRDEFYTLREDIENELQYYTNHFADKVIYCNCDHEESEFWKCFADHFQEWKLKKLVASHYEAGKTSYKLEMTPDGNVIKTPLNGDGDFRSEECANIMKNADIVVTNPPFSLFREYISQIMDYKKKFLIIGMVNSLAYVSVYPLIKNHEIWLGHYKGGMDFKLPDNYELKGTNSWQKANGQKRARISVCWVTNLPNDEVCPPLELTKQYYGHEEDYPCYDNYDAINVDKIADIPKDYEGVMGVPVTFLYKHSLDQFNLLNANDFRKGRYKLDNIPKVAQSVRLNGIEKYTRILIQKI